MKRSRSSSLVNIRVFQTPSSATTFACHRIPRANPSVISVHAPPKLRDITKVGVLAVSRPELPVRQDDNFLDECFLCKKCLRQNDTRFMYGDFRAFCSLECRHELINADDEKEKSSKQSTKTKRKIDLNKRPCS